MYIITRPTTTENKYCENVVTFYCIPRLLFWFSQNLVSQNSLFQA